MSNVMIEPLDADERARLRSGLGAGLPMVAFMIAFAAIPVGLVFLLHPMQDSGLALLGIGLVVATGCLIVFLLLMWQDHKVSRDLKRNQKIVLDTTVARVEERYFRGISTYYLSIADEGPDIPRRRFQIDKAAYAQLRRGEQIRIAFLPVSGKTLAIDAGSCRYRV
jgi:hypothetical protein